MAPTLFDGYLNLPDKTAESMTADGWFVTGDAAVIGADGFHRIVGRTSIDIIKSGGFKVGAGEVETALLVAPVGRRGRRGGPGRRRPRRAHRRVRRRRRCRARRPIDHVAGLLSVHKRPREVRLVDALPRNAMGKVQKQQLRA